MISNKLKDKFKQQYENPFLKNVFTLFSGNAISQLIPFLITPLLSRIFNQGHFGVLFVYSSTIMILSILSTLKYEVAIMLPKNKNIAIYLMVLGYFVSFLICVILYILIFIGKGYFVQYLNRNVVIGYWIYFIPISVLLAGIIQIGNIWLNREKNYKAISFGRVYKTSSAGITQISTGIMGFQNIGLITGFIVGQLTNAIYYARKPIYELKHISFRFTFKRLIKIALHYRDMPFFNTSIALLNTISNQLPIFLLSGFYDLKVAGLYGMSLRIVLTPMGLINQSIGEVFFATASMKYNQNKIEFASFIRYTYKRLFLIGFLPFTILALFAPFLFKFILGESWEEAGVYMQILTPWLFLMFINSPLLGIITIIRKQKYFVFFEALLLCARFLGLFLGYKIWNNIRYSIMLFAMVGFIYNLSILIYFINLSSKKKVINENNIKI